MTLSSSAQFTLALRRSRRSGHSSSKSWVRPAGSVPLRPIQDRYPFFISVSKASAAASISPVTSGKASSNYTRDTGIPPRFLVRSHGQLKNNRSSCGRTFGRSRPPCLSSSLSLSSCLSIPFFFSPPLSVGFPHGSERDTRGEIQAHGGGEGTYERT